MKNLFIGNLNFQMTEGELKQLFEQYGEILRLQIITDRETGRSRGFAFVEMNNAQEADAAIAALNGKEVAGRVLIVTEARPKPERVVARAGAERGAYTGGFAGR
jgi:RNA recognition motif-containing protein